MKFILFGVLLMSFHNATYAQSPFPFVPEQFEVPAILESDRFRLRMLSIDDVDKDYEAVMSSAEHLSELWGPGWPEGLTRDQNLVDLGWHQKEFQRRRSFAYTVVSPDESRVLGCVYIYPTRKEGYDAEIYLWARQSELASGLEQELYAVVLNWVEQHWPFERPAYPGRSISDEAFAGLKSLPR